MNTWVATTTASSAWSELSNESNSLFHSEDWMALLERSFGCSSLYFLREDHQKGAESRHHDRPPGAADRGALLP